ncbi:hypothetical protein QBC46DRAFT_258764 [Diplogelasinospora grovesii]|uniref:GPI inositol-deacylase n=1 Tax=Diplogelasinospora grovesii TaxID=303347 RepID=A0AAN6NAW8_9PEZI|nr:hypothetical protein QBC46DRAFT_258764 [Diplogelasinospora grovesii]
MPVGSNSKLTTVAARTPSLITVRTFSSRLEPERCKPSEAFSISGAHVELVRTDINDSLTAVSTSVDGLDVGDGDVKAISIKRRFVSPWGRKRRQKDDEKGARGPIGLRLLHASAEPLIDLIFVHGLRGGSIKTWRKGNDPRSFWPQFWLPAEPGFENVNIHSFGYDSDWASSDPSVLNLHDFGRSLLAEMRNSPFMRDKEERPIILIGHSMGGLVIKKAFILSQETPDFNNRIRCFFFLATPHRGSDYAATLNNILTVSGVLASRHYITDLTTGSTSIEWINEDFRRYALNSPIYSFYETLKMGIGVTSILVVDKASAVLGRDYKGEQVQPVTANHRDICKFTDINDPNYVMVKNALSRAVKDILKDVSITRREESREQMRALRAFLGISDRPAEDHQKVEGSCQWIEDRDDFQEWRDCPGDSLAPDAVKSGNSNLSIFWIHANPGTGKTVLASHVISHLQEFQLECAYHYFHVGDKDSSSLGAFLRSIAYQTATLNAGVRERLFALCQEGSTFDMDDPRAIWTGIFRKSILQAVYTPQFWVIDAIDECHKYQEIFTMLRGEKPSFPLRIFITSRNIHDLQRLQRSLETSASLVCIKIPAEDSFGDIQRYIQSRIDSLPIDGDSDREELASNILRKSNACFLWVRLVLDELENVYSSESMIKVLERIPEGMLPYYERTIVAMKKNTLEKHIAKAVLMWTVASARKMTISELSQALKLDINTVLPSAKSAVEGLCGQLVSVDKDSNLVDLVHPTAREFLLSEAADEFTVSEPAAHTKMALTCLQLLSGNELRPPRNQRFLAQARPEPSPFLEYALMHFSEHIYTASSETDELLMAMDRFFQTNALSWMERLAMKGNLHCLIRTSKNIKAYLDRRAKYRSPLSSQVRNIDGWSIDLSRLVTRFGEALLQDPSSIYFLIPPLCPFESAIYREFGTTQDGLLTVGPKSKTWDDCVAYFSFGKDNARAVACGENLIAVGMGSGDVNLYNHRSCQKEGVLHLKNPVDLVHLMDRSIVACTIRAVVLQDLDGNLVWENRLRSRCLLLTSSDDYVVAVSMNGHLLRWDKTSGKLVDDRMFEYRTYEDDTEQNGLAVRPPSVASISPDMETLALGYRGGAVCLWDIRETEFIGWARDERRRRAATVLFNPNPNINLLLVIYTDHDLALYEAWSGSLVRAYKMPQWVGLLSTSCSPDGRTLVTIDTRRNMYIWDFVSLSVLYHVIIPTTGFSVLNFVSDGSSIVHAMDSDMRIWSPAILVRENMEEDACTSDDAIELAVTEGEYKSHRSAEVTALCAHPKLSIVFAGKPNGQVVVFDTRNEKPTLLLYSHSRGASITELVISIDNILASGDSRGGVQVWKLAPTATKGDALLAEVQMPGKIKQLCFSMNGEYVLTSTWKSDGVYRVKDGSCVGLWAFEKHERKTWKWLLLPHQESQQFSLLADGVIKSYSASSFPTPATDAAEIHMQYTLDEGEREMDYSAAIVSTRTQTLVLEVRHDSKFISSSTMFAFDLSGVITIAASPPSTTTSRPAVTLPLLSTTLPKRCKYFVGFNEVTKSLIFLHRNSWLSSIDRAGLDCNRYTQHFFVPDEYLLSSNTEVSPVKTAENDVVFCVNGEIISVRNGLKFQQIKNLE